MRIAYLDCFSGISGDMFLGALVGAGIPADLLHQTVAALKLDADIKISTAMRSGISAVKVDVIVAGETDLPREVYQQQRAKTFHDEHAFAHHDRAPEPSPAHNHQQSAHGRSLQDIRGIIQGAGLDENIKRVALAIFQALGEAEATIHQVAPDEIHFHEVGSVDALVDIVCAAAGSNFLKADEWVCSPLNVGGGSVECAHGRFPVPAPATLELLRRRNAPVYSSGVDKELVTPTGAAIVSILAKRFGAFPAMTVSGIGYGAGYRDLEGHPNILRLTVGEAEGSASATAVTVMEANLDDISPQLVGYFIERALAQGALDVFAIPVQMKKNRPGLLLTILCNPIDADRLAGLLFAETTTLGVRMRQETRRCLDRSFCTITTKWGDIRIKLATQDGSVANCAPEFEDCRRIAEEKHVPLKVVMQDAVRCYLNQNE